MSEWIKTEDEMPDIDTPVFIWDGRFMSTGARTANGAAKGDGLCWAAIYGDFYDNGNGWKVEDVYADDDYQVIAWHPFPQRPEVTQ